MSHGHNTFFSTIWPHLDKAASDRTNEDIREISRFLFRDPRGYSESFMKFREEPDCHIISRFVHHNVFYQGQELYRRGDPIDTFYVLILGEVGVYAVRKREETPSPVSNKLAVSARHRRRGSVISWGNLRGFIRGTGQQAQASPEPMEQIGTMHPFATLGEMALVSKGKGKHQTTARAVSEVHVLSIQTSEYLKALRQIHMKRNLNDIKFLLSTSLFEHYSMRGVADLLELKLFHEVEFSRGQTVLRQGHRSGHVYIILRGTCTSVYDLLEDFEVDTSSQIAPVPQPRRATNRRENKETTVELASLGEGQVFGALSVLSGKPQQFSIVVNSGSALVWSITAKGFNNFISESIHQHIRRSESLRSEVWMDKVQRAKDHLIQTGGYVLKQQRPRPSASQSRPASREKSTPSNQGSPSRSKTTPRSATQSKPTTDEAPHRSLSHSRSNRNVLPEITGPGSGGMRRLTTSRSVSNIAALARERQESVRTPASDANATPGSGSSRRRVHIARSRSIDRLSGQGPSMKRSLSFHNNLASIARSPSFDSPATLRNELLEDSSQMLMSAIDKVKESRNRRTPSPKSLLAQLPAGTLPERTSTGGSDKSGRVPKSASRPGSPVRGSHSDLLTGAPTNGGTGGTNRKPPPSPRRASTIVKSESVAVGLSAFARATESSGRIVADNPADPRYRRSLRRSTSVDAGISKMAGLHSPADEDSVDKSKRRNVVTFMGAAEDDSSKPPPEKVVVVPKQREHTEELPNPLHDPEFDDAALFRKRKGASNTEFANLVSDIQKKKAEPKTKSILKPAVPIEIREPEADSSTSEEEDPAERIERISSQIKASMASIQDQLHVPRRPRTQRSPNFTGNRASPRINRTRPAAGKAGSHRRGGSGGRAVTPPRGRPLATRSTSGSRSRSPSPSTAFEPPARVRTTSSESNLSSHRYLHRGRPMSGDSAHAIPEHPLGQSLGSSNAGSHHSRSGDSRGESRGSYEGGRARTRSRTLEDMSSNGHLGPGRNPWDSLPTTPEIPSSHGSPVNSRPSSPGSTRDQNLSSTAPVDTYSKFDDDLVKMRRKLQRRTSTSRELLDPAKKQRPQPGDKDFDPFATPP